MSNLTFDVKCVRADPQAGICELNLSQGGGSMSPTKETITPGQPPLGPSPLEWVRTDFAAVAQRVDDVITFNASMGYVYITLVNPLPSGTVIWTLPPEFAPSTTIRVVGIHTQYPPTFLALSDGQPLNVNTNGTITTVNSLTPSVPQVFTVNASWIH